MTDGIGISDGDEGCFSSMFGSAGYSAILPTVSGEDVFFSGTVPVSRSRLSDCSCLSKDSLRASVDGTETGCTVVRTGLLVAAIDCERSSVFSVTCIVFTAWSGEIRPARLSMPLNSSRHTPQRTVPARILSCSSLTWNMVLQCGQRVASDMLAIVHELS